MLIGAVLRADCYLRGAWIECHCSTARVTAASQPAPSLLRVRQFSAYLVRTGQVNAFGPVILGTGFGRAVAWYQAGAVTAQ